MGVFGFSQKPPRNENLMGLIKREDLFGAWSDLLTLVHLKGE